ncbi:hypothetical protein Mro03_81720 [Microbispora rosea subsp. rosea]|nr:hypothetical protein Mro03_81720 [Microbispora rosea subsp. rosea]
MLADEALDEGAGFRGHRGPAVHHLGDRRLGHSREFGKLREGQRLWDGCGRLVDNGHKAQSNVAAGVIA